jgi:hypothetical protein
VHQREKPDQRKNDGESDPERSLRGELDLLLFADLLVKVI